MSTTNSNFIGASLALALGFAVFTFVEPELYLSIIGLAPALIWLGLVIAAIATNGKRGLWSLLGIVLIFWPVLQLLFDDSKDRL